MLYQSYKLLQIAIRSTFLGFMEAASILVILFAPDEWKQFGVYAFFMSFFHYSEFLAIAWCNPNSLSTDSFILNHSIPYALAAIASWIEFALEVWLLPSFKSFYYIWLLGVVLCVTGEVIRKVAMITARNSFTHLVSTLSFKYSFLTRKIKAQFLFFLRFNKKNQITIN